MALFNKKDIDKDNLKIGSVHNTPEENRLLIKIDSSQMYAEGGKRHEIEIAWDDEYKICQGGGKQWETSKGKRNEHGKKRNFNSEDNFAFPMVQNMLSPFSNPPAIEVSDTEEQDKEAADVLSDLVPFILYRNEFPKQWDKITGQMVKYGPVIGYVGWDQHWIGGSGPDKWVGEVTAEHVKKDEFYPDAAIIDLEERLQECSYINIKKRKKLSWFADKWPGKGEHVSEDMDKISRGQENEGQDPQQATLIMHYHKGTPEFVSKEWREKFLEKAQRAEMESGLPYHAKDLRDMAAGTLKGVHCAYKANDIVLDYIPYVYDDGLYPFVYEVLYDDEKQPYGMGELRNVIIPQILHNKADEIELGAMLGQGLGGGYYNKNALSEAQRREFLDNRAKADAWHEVNDIHAMKEKKAVTVPPSITNYKESKKNIMDTVSGNTAILQGISPGANVPYSTIAELGARADARTRRKAKVLERFLIKFVQLIINRIVQFYTEERKYRILGDRQAAKMQAEAYKTMQQIANMPMGTPPEVQLQAVINLLIKMKSVQQGQKTATFKREMLVKTWEREIVKDESGNVVEVRKEEFVPEFDVKPKVMDERPTDRNYYSNMATQLLGRAMGIRAFWRTMDEGKFPPIDEILQEMDEMQKAQAEAQAQAQQAMQQNEQSEKQADREYGVLKQQMQNESVERQVAMKAGVQR